MPGRSLADRSAAELAAISAKGHAARAANSAARRAAPLRRDFLDHTTWDELARERGVRLPPWGQTITTTRLTQFLNKLGKTRHWYTELTGYRTAEEFRDRNPGWPLRALAGSLLEADAREHLA